MDKVFDLLKSHAATAPQKIALIGDRGCLTYAALEGLSRRIATTFAGLGCQPGDRVLLMTGNALATPVLMLAAQRAGLWSAIFNPGLREPECAQLCTQIDPRLILTADAALAQRLESMAGSGPATPISLQDAGQIIVIPRQPASRPETGEPAALLLPASATRTPSPFVVYGHQALLWQAWATETVMQIGPDARCETSATLAAAAGHAVLLAILRAGATLRLRAQPDVAGLAADLRAGGLSHLSLTPMLHANLLSHLERDGQDAPHHDLRHISSIGASLDATLAARIRARFGVHPQNIYGPPEYPTVLFSGPASAQQCETRMRINPLSPDAVGEILVRGPGAATGYFRDPVAMAETFLPGGWIATRDLARWSTGGDIQILGPKKDVIHRTGEKVYPCEIEAAINAHDLVSRSVVTWFPRPDGSEDLLAVIEARPGRQLHMADILDHLKARLSTHQLPTRMVFRPTLPLDECGNVIRRQVSMGLA